MKKILFRIFLFIICVLVILVVARNFIVKAAVTKGIEALAGVKVDIQKINIGILSPTIEIDSLKAYNPSGFKDQLMLDMPLVYLDYDLLGFIKNKAYFKKIKIEIKEVGVVLNEQGKLNFNSLAMLMPKPAAGSKPPEVKIDELYLKISKVKYNGYYPVVGSKQMEFDPNIEETFKNVTNPSQLAADIMKKILGRIGIGDFANFDAAKNALGTTVESVKETFNQAKEDLKSIFSK